MVCAIPPLDQSTTRIGRGYGVGYNRLCSTASPARRTEMHCIADQLHGGQDFVADAGSPILVPVGGRVVFKSSNDGPMITPSQNQAGRQGQIRGLAGYGNNVVIQVDTPVPGLPTPFWYSLNHMNALSPLTVGQTVRAGDLAGYVGNTTNGQFRGMPSHLHLEVRVRPFPGSYDRDTIDPGVMWQGLGIDWVNHHEVGGRQSGGQLLVRQGGSSDCSSGVSALWGLRGFGIVPAGYIDPASSGLQVKYASKGVSSKAIDENSPAAEPPDYQEVGQDGSLSPAVVAGGVAVGALILGAIALKRKRKRERAIRGVRGYNR